MREQFENMPEVHKKLKDLHPTIVWFSDQESKYASSFEGFQNMVIWLNGAWYIYQEQQKKVDTLKAKVQELWTELDDRQSKEHIIERCESIIQELLRE